jgi:hypothetical protein
MVTIYREDKQKIIDAAIDQSETPMDIIREALRSYIKCPECNSVLKECGCGK